MAMRCGRIAGKRRVQTIEKAVNGSISIFLTIALVPILTVAGLFVEASRYQLAQSELAAAADLTLNSALADYDTILEDVYGLFAVSQNDEELEANLNAYFSEMIDDAGLSGEEGAKVRGLLQGILDGDEDAAANLLAMTTDDDQDTLSVGGVENSDLANPQVLKNGIVEYSKYRTPLNMGLGLLEKIKALCKVSDQSNVVEKNTKVAEATADVNDKASDLYLKLQAYLDDEYGYSHASLDRYADSSLGMTTYLEGFSKRAFPAYIDIATAPDFPEYAVRARSSGGSKPIVAYELSGTTRDLAQDARLSDGRTGVDRRSVSRLDEGEAEREIASAWSAWDGRDRSSSPSGNEHERLLTGISDLAQRSPSERKEYLEDYRAFMVDVYTLWMLVDEHGTDDDVASANRVLKRAQAYSQVVDRLETYVEESQPAVLGSALAEIKADASGDIAKLKAMDTSLKKAISQVKDVQDAVKAATKANGAFQSAIDAYGEGSSSIDSFAAEMQSECDNYRQTIDVEKLETLKSTLEDIRSYIGAARSYLEGLSFAGTKIASMGTDAGSFVSSMARAAYDGGSVEDCVRTRVLEQGADPASVANEVCAELYKADAGAARPAERSTRFDDDGFWRYLKQSFDGLTDSSKKDNDALKAASSDKNELVDAAKAKASDVGSVSSDVSGSLSGFSDLPSSSFDGRTFAVNASGLDGSKNKGFSKMLESMTSVVETMTEGAKSIASNSRDELYVTDYAFSMFSWYTQKAEATVQAKESGAAVPKGGVVLTTSSGASFDKNVLRNAEIEYLIYGKSSAADNVAAAESSIFAVRFVCNSIYALTSAEIKNLTLGPALAIQSASMGVIPYKLPQLVMQLALALAESGVDLAKLNGGEPVVLFKSKDSWALSPTGSLNKVKDLAKQKASDLVDRAGDAVQGEVDNLLDATEQSIDDSIDDLSEDLEKAAKAKSEEMVQGLFSVFTERLTGSLGDIYGLAASGAASADSIVGEAEKSARAYIDSCDSEAMKAVLEHAYAQYIEPRMTDVRGQVQAALDKAKSG